MQLDSHVLLRDFSGFLEEWPGVTFADPGAQDKTEKTHSLVPPLLNRSLLGKTVLR
jgi:hypothetical protein